MDFKAPIQHIHDLLLNLLGKKDRGTTIVLEPGPDLCTVLKHA